MLEGAVHTTSKRNNHRLFYICIWGKLGMQYHVKAPFSQCFPSTWKQKGGILKFLRFEERFRKAPFSWQISVDGRPNRRNKLAFSNFSALDFIWAPSSLPRFKKKRKVKDPETEMTLNFTMQFLVVEHLQNHRIFFTLSFEVSSSTETFRTVSGFIFITSLITQDIIYSNKVVSMN